MIKKFLVYAKSDGIGEATNMAIKSLASLFFSYSQTCYLMLDVLDFVPSGGLNSSHFNIKEITSSEEALALGFDRLSGCPISKWFLAGCRLFVGFDGETPVCYTWTHFHQYRINSTALFGLSDAEEWIGPTFVLKSHRGLGYNKAQIAYQVAASSSKQIYTSANIGNIASVKSFERLGFRLIGQTVTLKIAGMCIRKKISGAEGLQSKFK